MLRWALVVTVVSSIILPGYGQQLPHISQWMFNPYFINPAYGGMDYSVSITAMNRNQWVGLEGAPRTTYLGGHMPMNILNGAVGAELF